LQVYKKALTELLAVAKKAKPRPRQEKGEALKNIRNKNKINQVLD